MYLMVKPNLKVDQLTQGDTSLLLLLSNIRVHFYCLLISRHPYNGTLLRQYNTCTKDAHSTLIEHRRLEPRGHSHSAFRDLTNRSRSCSALQHEVCKHREHHHFQHRLRIRPRLQLRQHAPTRGGGRRICKTETLRWFAPPVSLAPREAARLLLIVAGPYG